MQILPERIFDLIQTHAELEGDKEWLFGSIPEIIIGCLLEQGSFYTVKQEIKQEFKATLQKEINFLGFKMHQIYSESSGNQREKARLYL